MSRVKLASELAQYVDMGRRCAKYRAELAAKREQRRVARARVSQSAFGLGQPERAELRE